ncbi:uncharacterized protein ARB_02543 [Trichophyton benhamiae CBS 112371]|uniref:Uncharacterized protein n=1 Tax=Arthroderma benhamiae (strain ATCC MYA-4681 / CBS 112371) TaxID=663331 RepID=D4B260_ARTBC|nr:uncharacterized protein ARB_02543 [Trichophyton benhamiae CBS 112371]EFE30621.1 hypothetical protein ARB_02543 [Trichophyton benhamiae CBS 112371]
MLQRPGRRRYPSSHRIAAESRFLSSDFFSFFFFFLFFSSSILRLHKKPFVKKYPSRPFYRRHLLPSLATGLRILERVVGLLSFSHSYELCDLSPLIPSLAPSNTHSPHLYLSSARQPEKTLLLEAPNHLLVPRPHTTLATAFVTSA